MSLFAFSPLLGSLSFPPYPVKTYTVSLSCPLPARLIKGCSWGAFQQTLCNPSADNSKILCNPIPWHRSELLPDISIKPRCGKMFPRRCYTPVTACGGKEACDTVGHQLGTGKYYIFILPPRTGGGQTCFVGLKKREIKERQMEAAGTLSLPLNSEKGKMYFIFAIIAQLKCATGFAVCFLTFIFPPLFWLKQIFSSLPKYTTVTSTNIQCLREKKCWMSAREFSNSSNLISFIRHLPFIQESTALGLTVSV